MHYRPLSCSFALQVSVLMHWAALIAALQSQGLHLIRLWIPSDCQRTDRRCSVNVRVSAALSLGCGGADCGFCRIIRAHISPRAHCLARVDCPSVLIPFLPSGRLHGGDCPLSVCLQVSLPGHLGSSAAQWPKALHLSFGSSRL